MKNWTGLTRDEKMQATWGCSSAALGPAFQVVALWIVLGYFVPGIPLIVQIAALVLFHALKGAARHVLHGE